MFITDSGCMKFQHVDAGCGRCRIALWTLRTCKNLPFGTGETGLMW